ncbi:MAG TPA: molybdenum cofactor biosynthesis protein, partial [Verrucomicrobiae bacterium]|nr:molybdenum cofactor biosynthesis protein [Verrucomicrobiae bacterium]
MSPRRTEKRAPEHARAQRSPRALGVAIITVSDTRRGADDTSGALAEKLLSGAGASVASRAWVKDDIAAIRRAIRAA